jgi:hypothetical protein
VRVPGGRWSRLGWPAAFAVAGITLFICYYIQSSRATYVNSDGASNALQAWAMLHGNPLLHGWTVSDVSFYTTELPQYMLVEAIRGLQPDVVHICGAMTYTLLVLLAVWLAKGRATGTAGVTRALVAGAIMLAPQLGNPSGILLLSPDHVGTGVPLLIVWLLIDRTSPPDRADLPDQAGQPDRAGQPGRPDLPGQAGQPGRADLPGQAGLPDRAGQLDEAEPLVRRSWLVPVAVGLILAWTSIGDQLAEVIGAVPLALACGLRVVWARVHGHERLRDRWYELSLAAAALASVPVAWLAVKLIGALGGWTITAPRSGLAGTGVLGRNFALTGSGIAQLFGADITGQPTAVQTAFAVVHLAGLVLAAGGFLLAARRFFAEQLIIQVLVVAIVVNFAAYIFTVQAESIATTREIAAVLPFSAVLAGRLLVGRTGTERAAGRQQARIARSRGRRWLAASAALVTCYAVMLGCDIAAAPVPEPVANLATWLAGHHLTHGLAGYWQANSVTLDSDGRVQVRAIDVNGGKLTTGAYWEANSAWYNPRAAYADFIVTGRSPVHPYIPGVLVRSMEEIAGKPAKLYYIGGYTIAVWRQNLLGRLGGPS